MRDSPLRRPPPIFHFRLGLVVFSFRARSFPSSLGAPFLPLHYERAFFFFISLQIFFLRHTFPPFWPRPNFSVLRVFFSFFAMGDVRRVASGGWLLTPDGTGVYPPALLGRTPLGLSRPGDIFPNSPCYRGIPPLEFLGPPSSKELAPFRLDHGPSSRLEANILFARARHRHLIAQTKYEQEADWIVWRLDNDLAGPEKMTEAEAECAVFCIRRILDHQSEILR